jgi:haloalkane dehalogenase
VSAAAATRPDWLSGELYPFETRRLAGLNHIDVGDGPTLLFVHGNPTWSFLYREIVRGLMDDFRCIASTCRASGLSEAAGGLPLHAARARPGARALRARGRPARRDADGPGLGRADRLRRRRLAPRALHGFVVGNTWAWPLPGFPARAWSLFASSPAARFFPDRGMQAGSRLRHLPRTCSSTTAARPARRPSRRSAPPVAGAKPFLAEVERGLEGLRDRPALITWPTADPLFRAPFRVRWEQLFADHRTVELPGAGHFIQEDAPEEIVTAIREWTSLS